ncbi:unnamed protein product [Linum trigynum]|uniref:Uncharacterized protein n=1 Tax=Linum trigynum TaxID=586398 RepID=A0AAV2DKL9_9ROSI
MAAEEEAAEYAAAEGGKLRQQPPPLGASTEELQQQTPSSDKLLSSYLGLSFSVFLALLPANSLTLLPALQSRIRDLSLRLFQAEEQLKQMKSRRQEDSKANARVVEIFAGNRNAWQAEEKRLLQQIDAASEEMAMLRSRIQDLEKEKQEWGARVHDLEREVDEREEMLGFMSRSAVASNGFPVEEEEDGAEEEAGVFRNRECCGGEEEYLNLNGNGNFVYGGSLHHQQPQQLRHQSLGGYGGLGPEFAASASRFWPDGPHHWQDVQYEPVESHYQAKPFIARRESPWKVDGESNGVSSKLKSLEQELLNLEKVGKGDLLKVPSLLRKQTKRYQALAGKIDDLCRRMHTSDPCEPTLSPEFRTQRQTEFLLEAFRFQERASETGQKLMALQTEIGKSGEDDNDLGRQQQQYSKLAMRSSLSSIRNNLKEVQRNLEIWLARIIGDLEGILARDGASRVRDYYTARYPFAQ